MQWAILIGALISALVIGATMLAFNAAGTVFSDRPSDLPQVVLTEQERARLTERETYQAKTYLIWDTRRDNFTKDNFQGRPELLLPPLGTAPEGRFLVDPETGKVAFLKDPTIGGKIKEYNGTKTTRFDAPKTQVMRIIIDGVLAQKLNWTLVLIGAMIAVTLELCGISSLAFAVGVYVPIQNSVPIFIGGILRWGIDRYLSATARVERRPNENDAEYNARAEVEAIRRSETSPGVLLASGYIAGGSLAGVVVAFMEFSPALKNALDFTKWVEPFGDVPSQILAGALFAVLIVFAVLVGLGKVFPPRPEATNGSENQNSLIGTEN
jgi:hypothetical protein